MPDLPVLRVCPASASLSLRAYDLSRALIPQFVLLGCGLFKDVHPCLLGFALNYVLPFRAGEMGRAVESAAIIIPSIVTFYSCLHGRDQTARADIPLFLQSLAVAQDQELRKSSNNQKIFCAAGAESS
jgi:hypothetical protein